MKSSKLLLIILLVIVFAVVVYIFMKRQEGFESVPVISYFYLDGCGWCKKFNPEWDKFTKMVEVEKINIVVRKVNAQEAQKEVEDENIQGFPHVHLKIGNKRIDFEVNRTAENLMKFVKENL